MSFRIPAYIKYLFYVYLAGLVFFTLFRVAFVIAHLPVARQIPIEILARAFVMGYRFDTMMSCYILTLPFVFLSSFSFFKINLSRLLIITNAYFLFVFTFAFLVCGIDIPYFTHFNSRFTYAALFWFDTPAFILKIVFTTPIYWVYFLFFISLSLLFFIILLRIKKNVLWSLKEIAPKAKPFLFAASAGLIFLGIRGRIEQKSPLRWGTAFFSEYSFANQMGLNPLFTLTKTTMDAFSKKNQRINFMDDKEALYKVRNCLNVPDTSKGVDRKVSSLQPGNSSINAPNLIVVLMESMSAKFMGRFGNTKNLTPVLDSLMNVSWAFTNFYSSGNHTFNGVYSSLFGMPSLMARHPMKDFGNMHQRSGLANELKKQGYETLFMCTHDEQFDNMGGYMKINGFNKTISQKDYNKTEILSTLGVPDHVLFREIISHCRKLKQPFFTAALTGSNHPPVVIPENIDFKTDQEDIDLASVQYADWSIGQFLNQVKNESWYNNTIFVFLSDHGRFVSGWEYDMPISYYHIPLIIHAPAILKENKLFHQLGGQVDLVATMMGVLNYEFTNSTLGINLLSEKREFVFFNADNNLGCINDTLLYVQRENGINSLYYYRDNTLPDYHNQYPDLAFRMKSYAESMVQTAQYLQAGH